MVGVAVRGQSVEKDKLILKTETHAFFQLHNNLSDCDVLKKND